jgi:hypothetical protein
MKNNIDSENRNHVEISFHNQSINFHEIWLHCVYTDHPNIILLKFFTISNSMVDTLPSKEDYYRNNYIPLITSTTWACSTQWHIICNCMILLHYLNHTFKFRNPHTKNRRKKEASRIVVGMTAHNLTENFKPDLCIRPRFPTPKTNLITLYKLLISDFSTWALCCLTPMLWQSILFQSFTHITLCFFFLSHNTQK